MIVDNMRSPDKNLEEVICIVCPLSLYMHKSHIQIEKKEVD